ncbi:MAG: hypothetical protein IPN33_22165 [Saprospiraceae bacterium]|nr:hypothetical protein [Saprospiraceae bacterium]
MKNTNKIPKSVFYSALSLVWLLSGTPYAQAQTQRFKRIDYQYDLISGKVNDVLYQAAEPDAFYHNYEYDADNRIIKVHTSKDSVIWDQDAQYFYYSHGPLARVEIGDNQTQGMDYVYTLQGWIKGVNSNLLKAENDIGSDGLAGSVNSRVAKDAFGYTLNYHAGDYTPIDASKWSSTALRFEAVTPGSDLMAARFDLFNGNIGSMVTTIQEPKMYTGAANEKPNILPQGTAYRYDQLNRLLEMKAFQNLGTDPAITTSFNKWQPGSTYANLYHNTFQYDANGNILKQIRADGAGKPIDSLTYNYVKDASGRTKSNRLYHVNDKVNKTAFTDDIDDQGLFNADPLTANKSGNNYQYDAIGNLIQDTLEGIDTIEWTVYGKIKSITRLSGSLRSDLEFQYDASGNRVAKIEKPRDASGVKPQSAWITTYYTRDAQGNVMGIYTHTPLTVGPSFKTIERYLYGSSRLGSDNTEVELIAASPAANPAIRRPGDKHFEGSNHLGNVLAVFSARKIPRDDDIDGVIDYFQPEVLAANDYSPFGVVLDGRDLGVDERYGFNGMERDDEVKGAENTYSTTYRIFDPRLGKWLSIDPQTASTPWETSYASMGNNPIVLNDPMGDAWDKKSDEKKANEMTASADSKIAEYTKALATLDPDKEADKITDLKSSIQELTDAKKELKEMGEKEDIFYSFSKKESGDTKISGTKAYKDKEGNQKNGIVVTIEYGDEGDAFHEAKHGWQILAGKMSNVFGVPDNLYDVDDEVQAKKESLQLEARREDTSWPRVTLKLQLQDGSRP